MSTEQLKALRAATEYYADHAYGTEWKERKHAAAVLLTCVDRAIAALRAEQPAPAQACAGFVCEGWVNGNVGITGRHEPTDSDCTCNCRNCEQPKSAHQPSEQPVSRKVEVPPMPLPVGYNTIGGVRWTSTVQHEELMAQWAARDRALHAAAVALAERAKDWEEEARRENQNAAYQRAQREQAERERDEARAQLAEAVAWMRDARRKERERCAKVCEETTGAWVGAKAIRALPEEVE